MKTVAMVVFPEFLLLDMSGPFEVFSVANRYLPSTAHYQMITIGSDQRLVTASNGVTVQTNTTTQQPCAPYDLLLVPGGPGAYNERYPALTRWLKQAVTQCPLYGSICTGAFILGEAGLLDDHQVTTHWNYTDRLSRRFPKARVGTDQIYIKDRRLITSGGVTAGIDMALAIVAEDHGRKVAVAVAKVLLVVMKRQGGQAQFSPMLAELAEQESPINQVQTYVLEHLDEEFSVERMASLAGMSARHFARIFSRDTGLTPMEFLQHARIDRARSLLESTDLPLKTVAYRAGLGSTRHMRFLFSEKLGLTPNQYRQQFG